jgi:uncharacterized protein YidB (DUF937 family)
MSGFLGQVLGGLLGGQAQGQSSALAGILEQVLSGSGGLGGLVSQFQRAGLGDAVQSWVGAGQNQPVSPEQIGQVFPPDQVDRWAAEAGTTPDRIQAVLAQALPHAVDRATPNGRLPEPGGMPDLSGIIGQLLGGQR